VSVSGRDQLQLRDNDEIHTMGEIIKESNLNTALALERWAKMIVDPTPPHPINGKSSSTEHALPTNIITIWAIVVKRSLNHRNGDVKSTIVQVARTLSSVPPCVQSARDPTLEGFESSTSL